MADGWVTPLDRKAQPGNLIDWQLKVDEQIAELQNRILTARSLSDISTELGDVHGDRLVIGDTNYGYRLEVSGESNYDSTIAAINAGPGGANLGGFMLAGADPGTAMVNGQSLGTFGCPGYDGSALYTGGRFYTQASGTWNSGSHPCTMYMALGEPSTAEWLILLSLNTTAITAFNDLRVQNGVYIGATNVNPADDSLTVDGYVGLGAVNAENFARLMISGATSQLSTQQILYTGASSDTVGGRLVLSTNDGAALGSGHRLGTLTYRAYDGAAEQNGATIIAYAASLWSSGDYPTELRAATAPASSAAVVGWILKSNQNFELTNNYLKLASYELTGYASGVVGLICSGVTKTVGSGKDYTTIMGAIGFFQGKLLASCIIDVDAGTYTEEVIVSNLNTVDVSALLIRGDTRAIVGLQYTDGATANGFGAANGGSGVCSLSNSGAVITIACAGGDPDFDAAGLVAGDKVIVRGDSTDPTEYTIGSVSGNDITLTVAAPAVGADGTFVQILPNRTITLNSSGKAVIASLNNIAIRGFYVKQQDTGNSAVRISGGSLSSYGMVYSIPTAAAQACIFVTNNASFRGQDTDLQTFTPNAFVQMGAVASLSMGLSAQSGQGVIRYAGCGNLYFGFYSYRSGFLAAVSCVAAGCTYGFRSAALSNMVASNSIARVCTTGYYAVDQSRIEAPSTNANNSSTTPYSPATSNVEGNVSAIVNWS